MDNRRYLQGKWEVECFGCIIGRAGVIFAVVGADRGARRREHHALKRHRLRLVVADGLVVFARNT